LDDREREGMFRRLVVETRIDARGRKYGDDTDSESLRFDFLPVYLSAARLCVNFFPLTERTGNLFVTIMSISCAPLTLSYRM